MHPLQTAKRYWQTLRWLRPVQIYGRVSFRLTRPQIDAAPSPRQRQISGSWVTPVAREPSLIGPGRFLFLNECGDLENCGWDDPAREKLWRYNQHYFDDLNAADAASRREWHKALLQNWVEHNPPGRGTAWEPYPTSLRIVNWIKWALDGNVLAQPLQDSLAMQARWLTNRLEWHLLGNHLFANAKALVFAGLWFNGEEARGWRDKGFRILAREVTEQILTDGGQFELSPMYHALALEDFLDLINVTRHYSSALSSDQKRQSEVWADRIPAMRRWLAALSHPDGGIAFFNDAAFGIAPDMSKLDTYSDSLGFEGFDELDQLTVLADSGYAHLRQPSAVVIADIARVGPDYLPGHAHADTLSFEASLCGQRLFVNSGTSIYGTGPERQQQRGTAAHNTVVVDGANSSDVWSGFRVGARANPFDVRADQRDDALILEGSHDGYKRFTGAPIHTRRWELRSGSLHVSDKLSDSRHTAEARYHLHPDIQVAFDTNQTGEFILKDGKHVRWTAESGPARSERTTWHPEFGKSIENTCLVLPLVQGRAVLDVSWA